MNPLSEEIRRAAAEAAQNAQWVAGETTAMRGLKKAGIPTQGRVMVVIGFEGCGTHDFAKLEQRAKDNGAHLYVIHAAPDFPFKEISVNGRPLKGTVLTKLDNLKDIMSVASDLGLLARIDGTGSVKAVTSSGVIIFDDGKPTLPKRSELQQRADAPSRA
jgi:hypothetical protein